MKSSDVKGQLVLSTFLRNLVQWCDSFNCGALQREAASELFATLVNKYTDGVCPLNLLQYPYIWVSVKMFPIFWMKC